MFTEQSVPSLCCDGDRNGTGYHGDRLSQTPAPSPARAAPVLQPCTGGQPWVPETGQDESFEAGVILGYE